MNAIFFCWLNNCCRLVWILYNFALPFYLRCHFSLPNFPVVQFSVALFPVAVISHINFLVPCFSTLSRSGEASANCYTPLYFTFTFIFRCRFFQLPNFPVVVSTVAVFSYFFFRCRFYLLPCDLFLPVVQSRAL